MSDRTNDDPTSAVTEADVLAVLAESDADIAAGRVIPMEDVLVELRASIAGMESDLTGRPAVVNPAE